MGEPQFDVGFSAVGRGGFDRRDHTAPRSALHTLSDDELRLVPALWLRLSVATMRARPSDVVLVVVDVRGSR